MVNKEEEEDEHEELHVDEALCGRGDLGPFPCLEEGCEVRGGLTGPTPRTCQVL